MSEAGDLLYVYPPGVRAQLAAKSWRVRLAPALRKVGDAAEYIVRVAFGATLLVSIMIVLTAITLLLSAKDSDRDGERRSRGGGSGVSFGWSPSFIDFYFWDPYYVQRSRRLSRLEVNYEMGFLEVRVRLSRCGALTPVLTALSRPAAERVFVRLWRRIPEHGPGSAPMGGRGRPHPRRGWCVLYD